MDDYRGGKFIVGSDLRGDEQRRMANEYFRNQNESQRMAAEGSRNDAAANALGIANTRSRNNFLTQIGMFTAVVLAVIVLAVIAILAYERATNNRSLVNLDNIRDLTLSNLTVTNDTTIKGTTTLQGELDSSAGATLAGGLSVTGLADLDGGVSIQGGLSVNGITNLYNRLVSTAGMSTTGGLSVGGTTNLYGDVIMAAGTGLSIGCGLSVGCSAYFYDDVFITGGLSVNGSGSATQSHTIHGLLDVTGLITGQNGACITSGGLSVTGEGNFYNGVSIVGGLSVSETANIEVGKIKKKNLILTSNLDGMSTGYNLTRGDAGSTYAIEYRDSASNTISNKFVLPPLSGSDEDGLTYNFMWKTNRSTSRKPFSIGISPSSSNQIYGTVLAAQQGSSVITMGHNEQEDATIGAGISATLFYYEGRVWPGSGLECTYINDRWYLSGTLGVSNHISNNGYISQNPEWLVIGNSTNAVNVDEILISHDGRHYYDIPTGGLNNIYITSVAKGVSSDGTSLWIGTTNDISEPTIGKMRYTINGINWYETTGYNIFTNNSLHSIAYGVCEGVSTWVVGGLNNDTSNSALLYSTDGMSWNNHTNDGYIQTTTYSVAYGLSSNGTSLWVAGGSGLISPLIYSSSGISWNHCSGASFGSTGAVRSVAYGLSNRWVAVGETGTAEYTLYSDDGVSWEKGTGANLGIGGVGHGVGFGLSSDGSSLWVYGGHNIVETDKYLLYSSDGISWNYCTGANLGSGGEIKSVNFGKDSSGNNLWIATGRNINDTTKDIIYSADGVSWDYPVSGEAFNSWGGIEVVYNEPKYPNQDNPVDN